MQPAASVWPTPEARRVSVTPSAVPLLLATRSCRGGRASLLLLLIKATGACQPATARSPSLVRNQLATHTHSTVLYTQAYLASLMVIVVLYCNPTGTALIYANSIVQSPVISTAGSLITSSLALLPPNENPLVLPDAVTPDFHVHSTGLDSSPALGPSM